MTDINSCCKHLGVTFFKTLANLLILESINLTFHSFLVKYSHPCFWVVLDICWILVKSSQLNVLWSLHDLNFSKRYHTKLGLFLTSESVPQLNRSKRCCNITTSQHGFLEFANKCMDLIALKQLASPAQRGFELEAILFKIKQTW